MEYFTSTSQLSENTIQMYTTRITKWCNLVPNQSIEYIIRFPKASMRLLLAHLKERQLKEKKSICTLTNIRNYVTPIVAILRYSPHIATRIKNRVTCYNTWITLRNQITQPIYDRQIQERPTERQEKKGGSKLSFADIVAKRDSDGLGMYQKLLLAMYTYLYPVRADYYATELITDNKEPSHPNYIRISDEFSELVIRDFKTARVYPAIHYPRIPDELHRLIVSSLKENPRTFLFESSIKNTFSRHRFSLWASATLKSIFGVELNITLLRHIFISSLSMDLPLQELQRIGNLMGHSFARQRLYKWRDQDDEEKGEEFDLDSESSSDSDSDEDDDTLSP